VFDMDGGQYSIVRDDNQDGTAQDGEPVMGPFAIPDDLSMASADGESFTGDQVVFNPNGSASETGAVVLSNSAGYAVQLTLLAPTGQVRLN
jgi:hypothetical protein